MFLQAANIPLLDFLNTSSFCSSSALVSSYIPNERVKLSLFRQWMGMHLAFTLSCWKLVYTVWYMIHILYISWSPLRLPIGVKARWVSPFKLSLPESACSGLGQGMEDWEAVTYSLALMFSCRCKSLYSLGTLVLFSSLTLPISIFLLFFLCYLSAQKWHVFNCSCLCSTLNSKSSVPVAYGFPRFCAYQGVTLILRCSVIKHFLDIPYRVL